IEERVVFALDDAGRYRMQGFVDRIARAPDGAVEIHDYKTGRWVPTQEALDNDRQLALYQIGVARRHGPDAPVRLVWHYLMRDQVRVSTRTPEQLEALRGETIELIERIEAETEFAPRPSTLCGWCEFRDICPAAPARGADGAAATDAAAPVAAPVAARADAARAQPVPRPPERRPAPAPPASSGGAAGGAERS